MSAHGENSLNRVTSFSKASVDTNAGQELTAGVSSQKRNTSCPASISALTGHSPEPCFCPFKHNIVSIYIIYLADPFRSIMLRWLRRSPRRDTEVELGDATHGQSQLQSFEVILDPSPPFYTRFKSSIRKASAALNPVQMKIIAAITIDVICAVYQTVDAYATLYPGSKVAASILLNGNTVRVWGSFFWLFGLFASVCNFLALPIWVAWFARVLQIDRLRSRKCCFFLLTCFCLGIVVPALVVAPFWATFVIRIAWQNIAWNHVCDGWEVDAILTGVNWGTYYANITLVGSAAITIGGGGYQMHLTRDPALHNLFNFSVTDTLGFDPPLSTISYDIASSMYTVANLTRSFKQTPNLSFPSLSVELSDPSIPFVRSDPAYPPSANLIYRNGTSDSRVLRTELLDYPDCTQLKVCGMHDSMGTFQITLGVVMIQQFSAAVYCTIPSSGS